MADTEIDDELAENWERTLELVGDPDIEDELALPEESATGERNRWEWLERELKIVLAGRYRGAPFGIRDRVVSFATLTVLGVLALAVVETVVEGLGLATGPLVAADAVVTAFFREAFTAGGGVVTALFVQDVLAVVVFGLLAVLILSLRRD